MGEREPRRAATVRIRPAGADDVPEICQFLHERMNRSFPPERWRRILDYPWRPADADLGYVAVEDGRIVGFLGLVYADRRVGGEMRRFANLTSWYLSRHLRGRGIGSQMLADATRDPRITYTNLTPASATIAMVRRAGFQVLDQERLLFSRRARTSGAKFALHRGASEVMPRLEPELRAVLADNAQFDLQHVAFGDASPCYLVLQAKRKAGSRLYFEILFVSDTGVFSRHAQAVADLLLPEAGAVLAVDRRFMPGASAEATLERLPQPRLYKPAGVPPISVDMLYSEIPLLDLKLP